MIRWTSTLAPMSMPRVGSSRIRTRGSVASHLAEHDLLLVAAGQGARRAGRRRSSRTLKLRRRSASADVRSVDGADEQPREEPRQDRQRDVRGDREVEDQAVLVAVLGHVGDARPRIAADGLPNDTASPPSRISPASARSMPNRTRATSVRPAPTSPANPRISPARTDEADVAERARRATGPSTSSRTSPIGDSTFGNSVTARPTMWRIEVGRSSGRAVAAVTTCWPSRRTVARSHSSNTSSSRWQTNRMATPRSRVWRTIAKSRSTSCADSDAVGSSRIRTRASSDSALAISMSCWSAIDRPRTIAPGRTATSSSGEDRCGLAAHRAPVDRAERGRRRVTQEDVLGDRQVGEQRGSWWTTAMPERAGLRRAVRASTGSPSSAIVAGVRLVDAGEDLDERALAGAVLADERVDLAGPQLERDVVERLGRAEPLRDAGATARAPGRRRFGDRHRLDLTTAWSRGRRSSSPAPGEMDLDPAGPERRPRSGAGAGVVGDDRRQVRQSGRTSRSGPTPLRVVDEADDLARRVDHERLICASSSVASLRPASRLNPAAPRNAFWTLTLSNRPVAQRADDERASHRTKPPGIATVMPGMTGQLGRSAGRS